MADSYIGDLTEDTSPTGDDLIETEHDPAGTPASRKVKILNLLKRIFLSDDTQLLFGAVSDGQFLKRNGTNIIGATAGAGDIESDGSVPFAADQSMGGFKLTNLADPSTAQDAATKNYVDASTSGFDFKASVRVTTTANITLSGAQTIDGVSVVAGDRVLVKNQTTGSENGIYVCAAGAWSRSSDANVSAEVTPGMLTPVEEGTANADTFWLLTTNAPITLGSTSLAFTQFGAGSGGAGSPGGSDGDIQYRVDASNFGGSPLKRETANELAQRNGTNSQSFFVYGTFTSSTNYERARVGIIDGTNVGIASEKGSGGGSVRDVVLKRDTLSLTLSGSNFQPSNNNALDLGGGSNKWKDAYVVRGLFDSLNLSTSGNKAILSDPSSRLFGGVLRVQDGAGNTGTLGGMESTRSTFGSNQNDYSMEGQISFIQRWSSDASRDVTGVSVSQVAGQMHVGFNVGSNNIVFKHQHAGSTAANRFICPGGADLTIGPDEGWWKWYDGTTARWRVFKL